MVSFEKEKDYTSLFFEYRRSISFSVKCMISSEKNVIRIIFLTVSLQVSERIVYKTFFFLSRLGLKSIPAIGTFMSWRNFDSVHVCVHAINLSVSFFLLKKKNFWNFSSITHSCGKSKSIARTFMKWKICRYTKYDPIWLQKLELCFVINFWRKKTWCFSCQKEVVSVAFFILQSYWIWDQARLPAEFKHISKRRKRN